MTPILTGPRSALVVAADANSHVGLTAALLELQ
jgi:hypothetical protein